MLWNFITFVKHYDDFTLDQVTLTLPRGCVMGFIGEKRRRKNHSDQSDFEFDRHRQR